MNELAIKGFNGLPTIYAEHCRVPLVLPTTLTGGYDCASSQIRSHEAEKLIPLFKGLQLENGRAGIFTEFFCIPQYSLSCGLLW